MEGEKEREKDSEGWKDRGKTQAQREEGPNCLQQSLMQPELDVASREDRKCTA